MTALRGYKYSTMAGRISPKHFKCVIVCGKMAAGFGGKWGRP